MILELSIVPQVPISNVNNNNNNKSSTNICPIDLITPYVHGV